MDLLAEQSELGVEPIPLGGEAHAMNGAVDGRTTHAGEHEVGQGDSVERGGLGVLGPGGGQGDGEWRLGHGDKADWKILLAG